MLKKPSFKELQIFAVISVWLTVLFVIVYGFTNSYASAAPQMYRFYFEWEKLIPLWPEAIFIYFSLNILGIVPLFTLDHREILRLGLSYTFCILIAGIIFYYFPAPVVLDRLNHDHHLGPLFHFLYSLDHPNNSLPSLHITFSYLTVRSISSLARAKADSRNGILLLVLWIWFSLIAASVLLTHQHHVLDIAAGILLGELGLRLFFFRR